MVYEIVLLPITEEFLLEYIAGTGINLGRILINYGQE
jgi:hypothetical protein